MLDALFAEMDQAADELCVGSAFLADLQIELRQIQRAHLPDLSKEEWLALFGVWLEHYRAKLQAEQAAVFARLDVLWEERCRLFARRESLSPEKRAAADQRLAAIAREIASAFARNKPEPVGAVWVPD